MPAAFVACACIISMRCFSVVSSDSSSGQRLLGILGVRLRMSSWLCFALCSVCWHSWVSRISISPPSSPYSGE